MVRGATKRLETNSTGQEVTDATYVASFDSDGFTVGTNTDTNASGGTFVAWNWKAGGAGVANTTGSIDSTVSANTTAGFSIVSYTGDDASSATIGHGLSVAPELIIIKSRDSAESWYVGSSVGSMSFTSSDYLTLDGSGGESSSSTIWNDTAPTSTLFTVGTNDAVNNTDDFIAYCFHSVEGYSKVGGYVGNSNADGPFVYTGFKPAYLLVKCTSDTASWDVTDGVRNTYNPQGYRLSPNGTGVGENLTVADFTSNGFKVRTTSGSYNDPSAATYIYLAFAESPFKYSNAR